MSSKPTVTVRQSRLDELPYLQGRLHASANEKVRLYVEIEHDGKKQSLPLSMVWVSEKDGKVTGMINLRLIWLAELYIFPEIKNPSTRRHMAIGLSRAMEAWLGDRMQNRTGIYSYFFVTNEAEWGKLAEHFGCLRLYRECATYGRDL